MSHSLRLKCLLSTLMICLVAAPAWSAKEEGENPCLDRKRVDVFLKRFAWTVDVDSKGEGVESLNACDADRLSTKVMKALIEIEDFPLLDTTSDEANQGVLSHSITRYLQEHVGAFHFDSATSAVCAGYGTMAYVMNSSNVVHLCPLLNKLSPLVIMSALVHEARHTKGYSHVTCNEDSRAASLGKACDPSYAFKGAYGVGAEFEVRISRTAALPLALRQEARASAIEALINRFNKLPLQIQKGILVQGVAGPVYFYDGRSAAHKLLDQPEQSIATLLESDLTLFDYASGNVHTYIFKKDLVTDTRGVFQAFQQASSVEDRRRLLKDVHFNFKKDRSCFLSETSVYCFAGPEFKKVMFKLESIRPLTFLELGERLGVSAADGYVYLLPENLLELNKLRDRDLDRVRNPYDYVSFFNFGRDRFVGLDRNGALLQSSSWAAKPSPMPGMGSQRFKSAVGPYYWSQKLEDL